MPAVGEFFRETPQGLIDDRRVRNAGCRQLRRRDRTRGDEQHRLYLARKVGYDERVYHDAKGGSFGGQGNATGCRPWGSPREDGLGPDGGDADVGERAGLMKTHLTPVVQFEQGEKGDRFLQPIARGDGQKGEAALVGKE